MNKIFNNCRKGRNSTDGSNIMTFLHGQIIIKIMNAEKYDKKGI